MLPHHGRRVREMCEVMETLRERMEWEVCGWVAIKAALM